MYEVCIEVIYMPNSNIILLWIYPPHRFHVYHMSAFPSHLSLVKSTLPAAGLWLILLTPLHIDILLHLELHILYVHTVNNHKWICSEITLTL